MNEEQIVIEKNKNIEVVDISQDGQIETPVNREPTITELINNNEIISDVDGTDIVAIETDMAFPALGQSNPDMNHAILSNRDLHDQHPITAITGLRNELDQIEALKTVYSDKLGCANYYLWEDGNSGHDNRIGYFVSLCQNENEIKIYDESNLFGITVDRAAFIGGQDSIARDDSYGLVACDGSVLVQCELDVSVGDYVVPNQWGRAEKSDSGYGYEVTSIDDTMGNLYARIIFHIPSNQIDDLSKEVNDLSNDLDSTTANIASAINVANSAIQKVNELEVQCNASNQLATEASTAANEALTTAESFDDQITQIRTSVTQVQAQTQTAVSEIVTIKQEAVAAANEALAGINNLIEELEPITTWEDSVTGNSGAQYLVEKINNGIDEISEIQTFNSTTEKDISEIKKSAKEFYSMISSVQNYSLGLYSQSYGLLNAEQAKSILTDGMVYVPYNPDVVTGNYDFNEHYIMNYHDIIVCDGYMQSDSQAGTSFYDVLNSDTTTWTIGKLIKIENTKIPIIYISSTDGDDGFPTKENFINQLTNGEADAGGFKFKICEHYIHGEDNFVDATYYFTQGYYYTWSDNSSGYGWIESEAPMVAFSSRFVEHIDSIPYWVPTEDIIEDDVLYEVDTLYAWIDNQWTKVATLRDNVNNRMYSSLKQTVDEISAEITNAAGSYASIGARLNDKEATVDSIVTWQNTLNTSMAAIDLTANDMGAKIAQIVSSIGDDGDVNAASIVAAINNNHDSSVTISADKVNITGFDSIYQRVENYNATIPAYSDTAPTNPTNNQLWYDTEDSKLKKYNAEDGQWEEINAEAASSLTKYTASQLEMLADSLTLSVISPSGTSTISLKDGGSINLSGFVTFNNLSTPPSETSSAFINGANITSIDGGKITTGAILSNGYDYKGNNPRNFSSSGTCFDLNDGAIKSKQFSVVNGVLNADSCILSNVNIYNSTTGSTIGTIGYDDNTSNMLITAGIGFKLQSTLGSISIDSYPSFVQDTKFAVYIGTSWDDEIVEIGSTDKGTSVNVFGSAFNVGGYGSNSMSVNFDVGDDISFSSDSFTYNGSPVLTAANFSSSVSVVAVFG